MQGKGTNRHNNTIRTKELKYVQLREIDAVKSCQLS